MYIIFNQYGHAEYSQLELPSILPKDLYCLECELDDTTPFAWSDGKAVYQSSEPPPSQYYHLIDGKWVLEQTEQFNLLQEQKNELILFIAGKADQLKEQILVGYPQAEIDSFYRQEKEALAYKADNNADTPMLLSISKARGVSLVELVDKVLEKAEKFAAIMGDIIGQRQKFEDSTLSAETIEQLDVIEQEVEQWQLSI